MKSEVGRSVPTYVLGTFYIRNFLIQRLKVVKPAVSLYLEEPVRVASTTRINLEEPVRVASPHRINLFLCPSVRPSICKG